MNFVGDGESERLREIDDYYVLIEQYIYMYKLGDFVVCRSDCQEVLVKFIMFIKFTRPAIRNYAPPPTFLGPSSGGPRRAGATSARRDSLSKRKKCRR